MKKVLIINPSYLPGYKSGGPQQTIKNICQVYSEKADIYILTLNHDMGDTEEYPYECGKWIALFGIKIMYVRDNEFGFPLFRKMYREFDTILACGLFCTSTIKMMLVNGRRKDRNFFVAPMGVFSENALKVKNKKKTIFFRFFSDIGIFKSIIWSFTSTEELKDAEVAIGEKNINRYIIAEDLPKCVDFALQRKRITIGKEELKICFLSRIVPMKNLLQAIRILCHDYNGKIKFNIYGLKEDAEYWLHCEEEIKNLPVNIDCKYCGSVKPEESIDTFSKHDVFLFPTQGENFGHVIYEALAAGCIPIISDTTPWKDFDEKRCGNVLRLDDVEGFRRCIQSYLNMSKDELIRMKRNAVDYAEMKYMNSVHDSGYNEIFEDIE